MLEPAPKTQKWASSSSNSEISQTGEEKIEKIVKTRIENERAERIKRDQLSEEPRRGILGALFAAKSKEGNATFTILRRK